MGLPGRYAEEGVQRGGEVVEFVLQGGGGLFLLLLLEAEGHFHAGRSGCEWIRSWVGELKGCVSQGLLVTLWFFDVVRGCSR